MPNTTSPDPLKYKIEVTALPDYPLLWVFWTNGNIPLLLKPLIDLLSRLDIIPIMGVAHSLSADYPVAFASEEMQRVLK